MEDLRLIDVLSLHGGGGYSSFPGGKENPKMRRLDEPENNSSGSGSMEEAEEDLSSESESESVNEDLKRAVFWLLQVFSVQFVDYNKEKLAKMYGTLLLNCAGTSYILMERCLGDPVPIDPNGFLKLTGPSTVHSANDLIDFFSFLTDLKGLSYTYADNMWNGIWDVDCDKLLFKKFDTQFGPVKVNFAVFTRSLEAVLEVKLLDWKDKGKHQIKVFGTVIASTNLISDDGAKSFMFNREKDMCALVRPGEAIPLSRWCFPFPLKSNIVLDVHLWHPSDNDSGSGGDVLIMNGRVEVPAMQRGEEIVLKGNCACIQVKIANSKPQLRWLEALRSE